MGSRVTLVGVFVDASTLEIESVRRAVGIDWVQLHGDEPPTVLAGLLPHAYKAMRLRAASDLDRANSYGGERLLVDAFVSGQPGGTGCLPDWVHAAELARRRPVVLAGGLTPANVGDAIRAVQPFGVDVASGVEIAPGRKDPEKVAAFVRAARGA